MAAGLDEDALIEGESAERAQLKRRFIASLWKRAMMPLVDERDASGPFPMRHGDLHSDNILVDKTGHIVGVLDWDCAGTVPWEAFAVPTLEVSGHFTETTDSSSILSLSSEDHHHTQAVHDPSYIAFSTSNLLNSNPPPLHYPHPNTHPTTTATNPHRDAPSPPYTTRTQAT